MLHLIKIQKTVEIFLNHHLDTCGGRDKVEFLKIDKHF